MKCDCTNLPCATRAVAAPCLREARYHLVDEDGESFLCGKHAHALREMYEPHQITKLPRSSHPISKGQP